MTEFNEVYSAFVTENGQTLRSNEYCNRKPVVTENGQTHSFDSLLYVTWPLSVTRVCNKNARCFLNGN